MSETYVECLVQGKSSFLMKILKVVLIAVTIACGLLGLMGFIAFLLIAVAAGVAAYFVFLNADVEYEYLYLDKEITVDKVMAKSTRKRVGTYKVERIEIFAPIKSYHLGDFKNRMVKEFDYSGGEGTQPDDRYVLYYEGGEKIILSPSKELVNAVRNVAPRKVFLD